jgi:hypothetical protein
LISSVAFWVCTASAADLGRNDRESLAGRPGARGLDGGVQCEQRCLLGDHRDQVDHIADGGGGFAQPLDVEAGFLRRCAGLIGELAGVAYLCADAVCRLGELVRSLRKVSAVA